MVHERIFTFPCPGCGEEQEAEEMWIGLKGECYACGQSFVISPRDDGPRKIRINKTQKKGSKRHIPPRYKETFKDALLDIVTFGRYLKSKNSEEDRAREHVRLLLSDAKKLYNELRMHRDTLDQERQRLWSNLRTDFVDNALKELRVEQFKNLEGVGPGTINKLQQAGLVDGLAVVRRPDVLSDLPRISYLAAENIRHCCEKCRAEAGRNFYPVFTDKNDSSMEMRLLAVQIEIGDLGNLLRDTEDRIKPLSHAGASLPPHSFLDRVFTAPAPTMSQQTENLYEKAIETSQSISQIKKPSPLRGTLSQDQYIRAIGLLEQIHPRPLKSNLNRGRGTNQGNPSLSSLQGFSQSEKELHDEIAERNERQINSHYTESHSLHRIGGDRVLRILNQPRDEVLVREIQSVPLNETRMRDIVLRNYQRFGTKFMLSRKQVVIGDEMGLGKTIQALTLMAHLQEVAAVEGQGIRVLVVCPASVRVNWKREIQRFTDFHVITLQGRDAQYCLRKWKESGGIAVTSYESLKWFPTESVSLDVCVVDEAQYIKNPSAQRSQNCRKALQSAKYAVCMTGTPIENNLEEFLNIFEATREGAGKEMRSLLLESDDPERFGAIVQSIYLRRNKQDVLTELPPLNLVHENVELTNEEMANHMNDIHDENVHFMKVRQNLNDPDASGGSKLRRVLSLLEEYQENHRSVIVFTYFLGPIEWFQKNFQDVHVIHGRISPAKRQETIDAFCRPLNLGESGRVMVAQIKSGGVGLNIQAASAVILLEPQFNPAVEVQAISRVHRMGQRNSVDVHRMISLETVEEIMLERLYQKQEIMDLYAGESYLKQLTPDAVDRDTQLHSVLTETDLRVIAQDMLQGTNRKAG